MNSDTPSESLRERTQNGEQPESRHSVTDPSKCRKMAKKYAWTLLRVEPTNSGILEFDCVFEGDTEFPIYFQENQYE